MIPRSVETKETVSVVATEQGVEHITKSTIVMSKEAAEKYVELQEATDILEKQSQRQYNEWVETKNTIYRLRTQMNMLAHGEAVETLDNPDKIEEYEAPF